ncbi:MAG TPA: branched-chain amino acid aminotransferase [Planctomycetota bacterium]|nr:branched-chain amino acid aminotransferase [Planctomycetota bacterium]
MASETKSPGFGSAFTPHMLQQRYENGAWGKAEIVPYAAFNLQPSTVVFHYGQEIFEGFKAYRQPDGSVCLFRPDRNLSRFNKSAQRLCMAQIDERQVLADIMRLLKTDKAQVPERPNSLYIRPCMIGTDTVIKVNPSSTYTFFVIICAVGDYFAGQDPRGVRLRTETEYVRAAPGGTGAAKCGGNYAASLAAQGQAAKDGFDQVVWLDAKEHRYIEEMGGMNIMFVIDDTLVTPSLASGSILPGVTRESLIQLARAHGRKVEERDISTDELIGAYQSGRLKEAFACGTAAVVTPIREILHRGEVLYLNTGDKAGALTLQLRQQLMDIQFGLAPDPFGWRVPVPM